MTTETAANAEPTAKSMDEIVALCKRRGFIFPASEIYGGINGFWDYGPLGTELKNNLRDAWWNDMVLCPPSGPDGEPLAVLGVDSAIIQHPKVWEASGHVAGFNDPMQTCRQCKKLFRTDHVEDSVWQSEWHAELKKMWTRETGPNIERLRRWARKEGKKKAPGLALVRETDKVLSAIESVMSQTPDPQDLFAFTNLLFASDGQVFAYQVCPECGGDLTEPRDFNLMFKTYVGAAATEDDAAYLRPETAQGIFTNYLNVLNTMRVKVPFGIAQIGKAFRNEVTPRNFIFRSREFEQMEIEWFCHPDEAQKWYDFWCDTRQNWWRSIGLSDTDLQMRAHENDELAHYAKEGCGCFDVEYRFPFTFPGYGELEGVADRTDFDLREHQQFSNAKLEYFDQERNERYIPHVIEPSAGLSRGVLALLCEAFTATPDRKGSKWVMKFHPRMAPIKAAVFPLVKKEGMPEIGQKLYDELRVKWPTQFDVKQSIGKRYARMDEAGTPYCFTIDSDTLTDQTVTVRERDEATQERIAIDQVSAYLAERIGV